MLLALFSKPWWKSSGKDDEETEHGEPVMGDPIGDDEELEGGEGTEHEHESEEEEDEEEESTTVVSEGQEPAIGQDDPLAPGYDLEHGEPLSRVPAERHRDTPPWRSKVESAKEFFATEILYRFDILEAEQREALAGNYRVEVRGYKGGVWTLFVGEQLEVVNRREEADVVLAMQQRDFLQIVNGQLNPQLGILSQKVRVSGDIHKVIAFHALLAPEAH